MKKHRRALSLVMGHTLLACALPLAAQQERINRPGPLVVGQPVPPTLTYEMVDGSAVDFEQFKGAPYIIYLGADWCPPCFLARPTAIEMAKKYKANQVKVIVMLSDPEKRREANKKIASDHGVAVAMSKPSACVSKDCRFGIEGGPWGAPKGATTLPSAYVVDSAGVVRGYFDGPDAVCFQMEGGLRKVINP